MKLFTTALIAALTLSSFPAYAGKLSIGVGESDEDTEVKVVVEEKSEKEKPGEIKCRGVAFTIPAYDSVLKDGGHHGAKIKVTIQRNSNESRAEDIAADLAVCNPTYNAADVSPEGRVGFAEVYLGYAQGAGASLWLPEEETFRLSYRNSTFDIPLLSISVKPNENRVVLSSDEK